jgi:hypothetical protein
MDIKRIRKAMHEDGASGTSATAGPGAIGGGVVGFKDRMGSWHRNDEEVDHQSPGVVQSTQHASDAQLINPWAGKLSEVTHEEVNLVQEEATGVNQTYPGSVSRVGINPSTSNGLMSRCPSIPLQGTNAIHEEELPKTTINPLQLGDITIQGYNVVEDGRPTVLRYKLIKNNITLPVDVEKKNSKNIGHTKEQILKKLSLMPKKIQLVRKFLIYHKENEKNTSTKKQETLG